MTKTKKALSLILCFVLALSVFTGLSLVAYADNEGTSGDLSWTLDYESGVFTVSGVGDGLNYTNSTIYPDRNPPWYAQKDLIRRVVVEEGVNSLGEYWFSDCPQLTEVQFSSTCKSIGKRCFTGCTGLEGIELPSTIEQFADYIFYDCTSLKWAIINCANAHKSYANKIPNYMFSGCTSLEEVYVTGSYTAIGTKAFNGCTKLHGIIWCGDAPTTVATNSFLNVPATTLTFFGNDSVLAWATSKGYQTGVTSGACGDNINYSYDFSTKSFALNGYGEMTSCPWQNFHYFIESISFPNNYITICDNAFRGCENIRENISIPSQISSIGAYAFYGINAPTITANASWLNLGDHAFGGREEIVFYGVKDSGLYGFVKQNRTSYDNWTYLCIGNNHTLTNETVEPTCISLGYTAESCKYCDFDNGKSNIVSPLGHAYYLQCRSNKNLYYNCSRCDEVYHKETTTELLEKFEDAIIINGGLKSSSEFDSRYDLWQDGYINAKDYKIMCDMDSGKETIFDFNMNNKNATQETKNVFNYIAKTYRHSLITGQQESTWKGSVDYEINYIYNNTGKKPAIRGFDFMNDDFDGVVNRAKKWWNDGGIVTICWHCSKNFDKSYDECKADELSDTQWKAILTDGTPENKAFIANMDKAGYALKQLQDAGVPVLWRPFHEFDGAWFWWGKGGSENFKKLWIMMYNHYTYDLGLNNLIWVLGYCHNGTTYGTNLNDWYPGNQYCDIIGADTYEVAQNGAELRLYNPVKKVCDGTKPMAMHECGKIPTISQFKSVPWGFFMTWHTNYITDENTPAELNAIYNSDYAITLDELPSFK